MSAKPSVASLKGAMGHLEMRVERAGSVLGEGDEAGDRAGEVGGGVEE